MKYASLFVLSGVMLLYAPLQAPAQSTAPKDFTYSVTAATPWMDTKLDLQTGEVLQISADAGGGCGSPSSGQDLPLPSAAAGSLIARLHAQGALPFVVGASKSLTLEEPGHLFLGLNGNNCPGTVIVRVQVIPAATSATGKETLTNPGTTQNQPAAAPDLKKQLAAAAQVFLAGQFGSGNSNTSAVGSAATSTTSSLTVSSTALDSGLQKNLDGLPRRVNDNLHNLGDMVNFVLVGSQEEVQAALDAANWHLADTDDKRAVLAAVMDTYEKKDYLAMPMSTLYLFGRRQDYGYEQAEPIAMVASRHHFRLWKAPFTWNGQTVWVGAGTHDIGFAKDKRNGNVTHKIDPSVDGERDNIGDSLQKAGKVKTLSYYMPPNPIQEAKNATGDTYRSDGRMLVVFLSPEASH